ncbi:MAG TPA: hypothetical protein VEM96_12210 [Pyrinomonadaceae bacterium]|nr:hypothetical protein [Pyrinomonadaceae bacterium]
MNDEEKQHEVETSPFDQFRSVLQAVAKGIDAFKKRANEIAAVVGPAIAQIHANIQLLPDRAIRLQRSLAERGWYVLPNMPVTDLFDLEDEFAKNTTDVVDHRMSQMVESCINEVETQLSTDFPRRGAIFKEAFQAHHEGRYASAITLLLTQADGICSELFGVVFFSVERGTSDPRTRRLVEALQLEVFEEMILEPLVTRGGVSASDNELSLYPDSLHRHQIMHGKDTAYATKINSLKAISLAGYLGGLAKHTIDRAHANRASRAGSATQY